MDCEGIRVIGDVDCVGVDALVDIGALSGIGDAEGAEAGVEVAFDEAVEEVRSEEFDFASSSSTTGIMAIEIYEIKCRIMLDKLWEAKV